MPFTKVFHYGKYAMAVSIPVDEGSEEATFAALAKDFGLDDRLRQLWRRQLRYFRSERLELSASNLALQLFTGC